MWFLGFGFIIPAAIILLGNQAEITNDVMGYPIWWMLLIAALAFPWGARRL